MAWDKSKPTNTSKLRNLGEEIRPNWAAIESADDTFKPEGLNLDKNAIDRTAITDTMILYNKDNKLYSIDPSSIVTQLTGAYTASATNGSTTVQGGIIVKWGTCNGDGTGIVKTFATAFPNNCWSVLLTGHTSADNRNICRVTAKSTANFTFKTYRGDLGTAGGAEGAYYVAIGN